MRDTEDFLQHPHDKFHWGVLVIQEDNFVSWPIGLVFGLGAGLGDRAGFGGGSQLLDDTVTDIDDCVVSRHALLGQELCDWLSERRNQNMRSCHDVLFYRLDMTNCALNDALKACVRPWIDCR